MAISAARRIGLGAAAIVIAAGASSSAGAQDFFQFLFGGLQPQRPAPAYVPQRVDRAIPFAAQGYDRDPQAARVSRPSSRQYSSGSQAYCVRSCDGRYFPIAATGGDSKADVCASLCPTSETKVVYGSHIDGARTASGQSYADLPNAFKYRTEIVNGCTCNGKDHFGLAKISIDDDPTLRKGDIVAGEDGLMMAGRGAGRKDGKLAFSPAPDKVRADYERLPVVARE